MKAVAVPAQAEFLNDLLKEALHEDVVLKSADGRHFMLVAIEGWQGFEVGENGSITENKELLKFLADRRGDGKRLSLSEVRKQLGLP